MKEQLPIQNAQEQETIARLVQAYVNDSTVMSEREKQLFDALCEADELVKSYEYPSSEERAAELARRRRVSLTTARKLIRQAISFFNEVDSADPTTGARVILHQIDKLLHLCMASDDLRNAAAFMKLKVQVYTEMVANKPIDPKLLQQNNYTFNIGGKLRQLGEGFTRAELEEEMRQWKVSARSKRRIMEEVYPDGEENE
jgi:hypothetical protein